MNTIMEFIRKIASVALRPGHGVEHALRPAPVRGADAGQRGFSLIELLIALAISTIVAAAIYSMYMTVFQGQQRQDLTLEAEQNARAGAEVMERELQNAGYLAGTIDAVTDASAANIKFIYTDPSDASTSATAGKLLEVEYVYDAGAGTVTRTVDNQTDGTQQTAELISNVKDFSIIYYDTDGAVFTPVDQPTRNGIRYADINIVTQSSMVPLGSNVKSTFALTVHLKLRNIDIAQAATDTSPPDAPTIGPSDGVRDPGQCGRLMVKWTPSTAGDVAGYKIYYGTSPGDYTGVISIPKDSLGNGSTYSCTAANGPCTIYPTLSPLQYSPSNGAAIPYYVAIKSYDNSMNHSAFSTEVTGGGGTDTLAGSNDTFGSGSNDTTVNPKKPGIPSGFSVTGANGDVDGKVTLSWSAYDTATYPDVTGFRIYRTEYDAATPFTYPVSPANYIGATTASATSYSDSAGLTGCNVYRYAIAPVNCDTSLISLDAGDVPGPSDDKTPYYESYNYSETYGDGVAGNVFSNITDSPAGSDTAPPGSAAPDEPIPFSVRAGYKRVAVQFTQPPASNIAQTCLYIAEGATAPVVDADPLSWDAYQCSNLNPVPTAARIPEYNGVFTKPPYNGSFSFWNNSLSLPATTTPSLAESGTYSYTAVAYDKCGNRSTSASSSATTTLCGEDPSSAPEGPSKPPAVTDVTVAGCGGSPDSMSISWTPISSDLTAPSTYNNPYDLAGYRLFKSSTIDFAAGGTLLNTVAPYWEPPYSDATPVDGGVVYYRVYSSDCPFEKGDDTGGVYPTAAQMVSLLNPSADIAPVYPARLKREMKYPVAWTDHREVLTGVSLDSLGNSTPSSTNIHNTVTLFLYSTGHTASTMTITGMSLLWVNSNAYLSQVDIGGGSSGITSSTVATLTTGQSAAVTGNDPYSRGVSNISFGAGKEIPGGSTSWNTPVKLTFVDSSGSATSDMRNDQLLLTLYITNNSTGTTTCTSYLTVSDVYAGITVPYGPSVTSMTQNQPSSPTFPYTVPGTTGLNTVPTDGATLGYVQVPGGSPVTVTATITPNTYDEVTGGTIPVSSAKLYYAVTGITTGTAPDQTVVGNYTAVAMSNTTGNSWVGSIPAQDTAISYKRIWYYVIGTDSDGNYDRLPTTTAGFATYDQKTFAVCDFTPSAPTGLTSYSVGAGNVAFSWPRVTTYTTGDTISAAADPLYYRIYRKSSIAGAYTKLYDVPDTPTGSWVLIPAGSTVSPATSSYYVCEPSWLPGKCIYWDYIDANTYDLSYYAQSKNSCGANSNLSSATSSFRECQGASAATLSVTPAGPINVGASYTVSIDDCALSATPNNIIVDTVTAKNISSRGGVYLDKVMTETSASSGSFSTSVLTQRTSAADTTGVYVNPTETIDDVVTVSCPTCTGAPASVNITVKAAACDFAPVAPTGLTGTTTKDPGNNKPCTVQLTWTASTSPDVTSYQIFKKTSAGAAFGATPYATTAASPWTDPVTYTSTGLSCTLTQYYYIKAVDSCSTGALTSTATPNDTTGYGPR